MFSDNSPLLTPEETAVYLGLHVETVRRMARQRRIPCSKIGRYWRFRPTDLDDFMARGGTLGEQDQGSMAI
jgi:excisionase family DNA binding protein